MLEGRVLRPFFVVGALMFQCVARVWLWVFLAVAPVAALAEGFPKPEGPVVLSVTPSNGADPIAFDRAMLENLGWETLETHTSFTEGSQEFSGISLATLLQAVNAQGTNIRATALNDYSVDIPMEHAADHGVFLALDHQGKPMRVRDKGPIWIIYPNDGSAPYSFDALMVWQLKSITISG